MEPLVPFPLLMKEDVITPDHNQDDITFCSLCDFEVRTVMQCLIPMRNKYLVELNLSSMVLDVRI